MWGQVDVSNGNLTSSQVDDDLEFYRVGDRMMVQSTGCSG